MCSALGNVCFVPIADIHETRCYCPLSRLAVDDLRDQALEVADNVQKLAGFLSIFLGGHFAGGKLSLEQVVNVIQAVNRAAQWPHDASSCLEGGFSVATSLAFIRLLLSGTCSAQTSEQVVKSRQKLVTSAPLRSRRGGLTVLARCLLRQIPKLLFFTSCRSWLHIQTARSDWRERQVSPISNCGRKVH
jgi:hypothetical protein